MAKRQSKNAGKDQPVILNQTISQSVNAWDSAAFSKLLSEQAKANETAIKSIINWFNQTYNTELTIKDFEWLDNDGENDDEDYDD